MIEAWSEREVELIVEDYFSILRDELSGVPVNKAIHRRALFPLLNNRSEGSIEFKHQNISAVLIMLGQPFIKGYLPKYNYQKILEFAVIEYLEKDLELENSFTKFTEKEVSVPKIDFLADEFIVDPPVIQTVEEQLIMTHRTGLRVNYLQNEQNNQRLGKSGEELVVQYEKWRLITAGKSNLADRVEWISQSRGDGFGFDILSCNIDGTDKYVEVKTTKLSKETPFYFTQNELQFSLEHSDKYHLYRLFSFDQKARMFIKKGDFRTICRSVPVIFRGYF
jgi:hypothetical protein